MAGTWYDSIDPASTNTDDSFSFASKLQPIVAGSTGNCTKLRVYIGFYNFAFDIKVALYDNSNNLLSTGTLTSQTSANNTWFEVPITSVAVTNGTTYRVAEMHDNAAGFQGRYLSGQPANSSFIDFATSYSSFPLDPFPAGGGVTLTYAYGMFIESGGPTPTATATATGTPQVNNWFHFFNT